MTRTAFLQRLDQRIAQFEAFIIDAQQHSLPEYHFDSEGNMHPWIDQLREAEASIWETLSEQVRPALTEVRAAGADEAQFHQRYEKLAGFISRLEALIERCQIGVLCTGIPLRGPRTLAEHPPRKIRPMRLPENKKIYISALRRS